MKRSIKLFGQKIIPFVKNTNVIILANHGTVSYGEDVERAYWWTEILDAYCRILMLAKSLGRVNFFTEEKERELLELKKSWGFGDPRNTAEFENCDICANDIFRDGWQAAGVERRAFDAPPSMPAPSGERSSPVTASDQEALIQTITDRVVAALNEQA